jgi:microcystin-dependent protein
MANSFSAASSGAASSRRSWLRRALGGLLPGTAEAAPPAPALVSMRPTSAPPFIGEIALFAGNFAPAGWAFCDGTCLPISEYDALFQLIGTRYGGDGETTFCLPNMCSRVPLHQGQGPGISRFYSLSQTGGVESVTLTSQQIPLHNHQLGATRSPGTTASPVGAVPADNGAGGAQYTTATTNLAQQPTQFLGTFGGSQPHENMQPYVAINYIISLFGVFPSQGNPNGISQLFVGEIMPIAWNYPPPGCAFCDGQVLPINQNQALYSLLGTTYGGDGRTTFALPDMRGRVPIQDGNGYTLGQRSGEEFHTLTTGEMVPHVHGFKASAALGTTPLSGSTGPQVDNYLADSGSGSAQYGYDPNVALASTLSPAVNVTTNAGGSQAHENRQPYLCINFVIALRGVFPSP